MKTQPMNDRIADLREWIGSLPNYRDTAGAARVLDEIAASHAALLAACETMLARHEQALLVRVKLTGIGTGALADEITQARAAIATAKGV